MTFQGLKKKVHLILLLLLASQRLWQLELKHCWIRMSCWKKEWHLINSERRLLTFRNLGRVPGAQNNWFIWPIPPVLVWQRTTCPRGWAALPICSGSTHGVPTVYQAVVRLWAPSRKPGRPSALLAFTV